MYLCTAHIQRQLTFQQQFASESSEVIRLTTLLQTLPYDPETWLNRGNCLRLLGFPELALGDVYKARLLVEAGLLETPSVLGNEVRKAFRKKTYELHTTDPAWMRWADAVSTPELLAQRVKEMLKRLELQIWTEMMEGLMAANCCGDYSRMSREAVAKFPDDEIFPSEVSNSDAWYAQREAILKARVESGDMNESQMTSTLASAATRNARRIGSSSQRPDSSILCHGRPERKVWMPSAFASS